MARGVYTVSFENASIAAASGDYDLFEIAPATDKPIRLLGLELAVLSELGDAQEEWLRLAIVRGNATSGNGSSATPAPVSPGDGAASFTAETIASTPASTGTPVTVEPFAMNVRIGMPKIWTPPMCPVCSAAQSRICVRLLAAVTDDLTMTGTLWVEELV